MTVLGALVVVGIWPEKDRLAGDSVTGAVPFPVNCAVCGEVAASSATVRVPARDPNVVGVKVTEIVQLSFPPRAFGDIGQFEV